MIAIKNYKDNFFFFLVFGWEITTSRPVQVVNQFSSACLVVTQEQSTKGETRSIIIIKQGGGEISLRKEEKKPPK
jgi:hypothetical protein